MAKNTHKRSRDSRGIKGFLNGQLADIFWVFNLAFSGFSSAMFIFWIAYMRSNPSETTDKIFLLVSCLGALSFVFAGFYSDTFRKHELHVILSLASISIGVVVKENQNMSREHVMGFGLAVLLLAVLVVFWLKNLLVKPNRYVLAPLLLLSLYLVFVAALSFYQDRDSLIESQHSEYVVNELIAPYVGKTLYQDFVPQYTFSLALLFNVFPKDLTYLQLIDLVVNSLTISAFLSLITAIFLGLKFFDSRIKGLLLSISVIVPLTSVTAGWDRLSFVGPPTTLLSGPSIRIFIGMMLALVLYILISQPNQNSLAIDLKKSLLLGFVSGLVSSVNLDFGIAAALSMFATIIVFSLKSVKFLLISTLLFCIGFIFYWLVLWNLLSADNSAPKIELFGWFIRQFGGGFGSIPISYPGPVMFALPTIFSLAVFYALQLAREVFAVNPARKELRNYAVLTFVSAWTFLSIPYYLNRSYHSGQMSTLYLPLSLSILGLLAIIVRRIEVKRILSLKNLLPMLIISVSISSVWISPNPRIEIERIRNLNPDGTLPRPEIRTFIAESSAIKSTLKSKYKSFAYFGEEGNIVELATGVKSANIFNNPLDMFQSNNSIQLGCDFLKQVNAEALVISSNGSAAFAWSDGSLCGGLYEKKESIGSFQIAEKLPSN